MLKEFIQKYYIDSIVYKTGYNPVNTLTWAIILIVAVILLYRWLRDKISFDERFVYGNIPFVVFGASLRVVEDAEFLKPPISYFFMTPMIYVLIFSIALPILILSVKLRRENYWIHYGSAGALFALATLTVLFSNLQIKNWFVFPLALAIASSFTLAYHFATQKFARHMHNKLSELVFFSHMLDASATFIGIQYLGYCELHVVPRYLISTFGAWIMIPAKLIVFLTILYVLDKEEDESLKNFLKFVLIVLGLAPGLRDSLRMTFGV
jgi:uncharacterized membrane protein